MNGQPVSQRDHAAAIRSLAAQIDREPRGDSEVPELGLLVIVAKVTSIKNNYLVCNKLWSDGTLDTATLNIAKPPQLQKAEHDGVTLVDPLDGAVSLTFTWDSAQERTVTKGSDTESQRIVPWYVAAAAGQSRIFAVGVVTTVKDDDDSTDVLCPYIDLNLDARAWAKT